MTAAPMTPVSGRVGVVGLGQRMADLANVHPAGSACEVGEPAEVVLTSVYSPDDVESALLNPDAIDTSTNNIDCKEPLAARGSR